MLKYQFNKTKQRKETMKKYSFLELAEDILQDYKTPLTFMQIWKRALEKGRDKKLQSLGKTPYQTLGARLYTDVKKSNSLFYIASKKPKTFYLKSLKDELKDSISQELENPKEQMLKSKEAKFSERDLHPLLVKYLFESPEFNLYTKTIYHENSKKNEKGKERWNYPDIVGVHFPFGDYLEETFSLLKNLKIPNYKLYSFELKKSISWANLKEYYFQAVSNSSWANEGYLVIFEEIDGEILSELARLNMSFGIGVIQLDSDINSSKILLPSKERNLDIQTLDMLVDKNPNFKAFITAINKSIVVNDTDYIAINQYDEVFSDEELEEYLRRKGIVKNFYCYS